MTTQASDPRKVQHSFSISGRAEADAVLSCVALAFSADPLVRWVYPEPAAFLAHYPRVADLLGGRAFDHAAAYRNVDFTAAALWLPPGVYPDEERLIPHFKKTVAAEKLGRLFSLLDQMARYHPEGPCRYLTFLAVDPARQGKGLGAALLEEGLRQCDRDGIPAYLESTNPANLSFYRRHGFEQIGLIEAEGAPSLFPMLRPTR
jgi:ribosomal protein S18 acetylase RimI-like enzyme